MCLGVPASSSRKGEKSRASHASSARFLQLSRKFSQGPNPPRHFEQGHSASAIARACRRRPFFENGDNAERMWLWLFPGRRRNTIRCEVLKSKSLTALHGNDDAVGSVASYDLQDLSWKCGGASSTSIHVADQSSVKYVTSYCFRCELMEFSPLTRRKFSVVRWYLRTS